MIICFPKLSLNLWTKRNRLRGCLRDLGIPKEQSNEVADVDVDSTALDNSHFSVQYCISFIKIQSITCF
jgi:hypothetical protein